MRTTINGQSVNVTAKQMDTIITLQSASHGFASIKGYVATSGRVTPETSDMVFNFKFSSERVRDNQRDALQGITLADLDLSEWIPSKGRNACDTPQEQFDLCVKLLLDSLDKTDKGDRSDAHRKGHDRCYIKVCDGVKIHLVTEKQDGIMVPVLDSDGVPTCAKVMIHALRVHKRVVEAGEYKVVNSGSKVLMDNAIKSVWNKRTCQLFSLSLDDDKYDTMRAGGEIVEADKKKVAPLLQTV